MNRRTFIKRLMGSALAVLGIGGGTYYYAREIEPAMLHIQEEIILSGKLSPDFDGFKIIQFSDTHIGFHYNLGAFKKLVKTINDLSPDLIVFTGDLVDDPDTYNWREPLADALQSLQAPYGKFWVYGNHDHGGYGTEILNEVMTDSGFELLKNAHAKIGSNDESIVLAGIDDTILGRPDLEQALSSVNPELFTILLAHEPDFADTGKRSHADVQLSGHSHGGQVRLPFIGHLYTPADAKKYIQGKYEFPEQSYTLYVSKGIGTTRMPYRFLCRPEIHVYTLKAE
ncbi:putative metallophosphoesterase YkuE [Lentibacillus sp. JNUCC-1]|uniref:metallophosphoesterase n=1 Tax=Lentibacillus sp. JNUCC-1 TaxID=2654513 RepID=UPI0012E8B8F3|nr:metallophosphoesterase [Lentibacillus sp. JNUCC-1]MUV36289.1 putative metallophosphoesterase YkuE [Lentibacillus sp. JNUCC-1]